MPWLGLSCIYPLCIEYLLPYGASLLLRSQAWERLVGWVCNFNFSDCLSVAEPDSVLAWRQPDSLVWSLEGLPLGCLAAEGNASD